MPRVSGWLVAAVVLLFTASVSSAGCKSKSVAGTRSNGTNRDLGESADRGGSTFDESAKPGDNYDKAEFRLWLPGVAGPVRALAVLVPGANEDGRDDVNDPFWRAFAARNHVGLVGCHLTDKPHEPMFIEQYANVSQGSGQALLDSLGALASKSNHPEVSTAPLLLWGMSAGGEFNYELNAWKPERVISFVVNKGGIYYTALAPLAARQTPGLFFTGGKDIEFRRAAVVGLFALNRRAGALWALTNEPGVGHEVGRSRELAGMVFEETMTARLPESGATLKPIAEKSGTLGDATTSEITSADTRRPPEKPTAWLPSERLAKQWQAVVTGKPFVP